MDARIELAAVEEQAPLVTIVLAVTPLQKAIERPVALETSRVQVFGVVVTGVGTKGSVMLKKLRIPVRDFVPSLGSTLAGAPI